MPQTLTEVIAEWPHEQTYVQGEYTCTCRRCAMERWRDEWLRYADSPDAPPMAVFLRGVLGEAVDAAVEEQG